ncbi:hypothetical protein RFM68_15520 [Mesorhizobium sp. MSK_1335]|uniref:Uncharacterized protein n=1 Tax=Mesorhizobium montanum TaxID=3072323 RepID=A0ABU4ZKL6_9HYPH|nr:hypothetical protein [Mesorhizobium sp. MSK_1335]MDX8525916.1 hypothetical protein [Mesorhizobium sp. MSK_1335]
MATWTLSLLIISSALGLFSLIAAVFGVILVRNTLHAAIVSNDLAREDKRPWIKFDCVPNGKFDEHGLTRSQVVLEVRATIEDIGERPAIDMAEHTKIIQADFSYARTSAIKVFLDEIFQRKKHLKDGNIIYPNDPIHTDYTIQTLVKDARPKKGGNIRPVLFEGEPETPEKFLIYCITYRGIGFETYFHNAQIYQLNRFGQMPSDWELLRLGQAQSIS